MVKKNKLLIGCLSLLLVLSVGYALFSEQVEINGTTTAKGSFDIEVSCLTTVPEEIKNYRYYKENTKSDNGFKNESCVVNSDIVNYSVELEYPTAAKNIVIKYTNNGSITSAADYVYFVARENIVKKYDLETEELISSSSEDDKMFTFSFGDQVFFQEQNGPIVSSDEFLNDDGELENCKFVDMTDPENPKFVLRTGESIYVAYESVWNDTMKYQENGVYYVADATINVPFQQYND